MEILKRIFKSRTEQRAVTGYPPNWFRDWLTTLVGGKNAAGVDVSEKTALGLTGVWAAVNLIAGTAATLPLNLYRDLKPRGRDKLTAHRTHRLLHFQPNPEMGAIAFRAALTGHTLLYGNGYAEITRDDSGRPVELWPLRPDIMTPDRDDDRRLIYQYGTGPAARILAPRDVLHIHGLGFDGIQGYSPIRIEREAVGAAIAAQDYGSSFFANDSRPSGYFQHPNTLSEPAKKNIIGKQEDRHKGARESHKLGVLEEGMTWQSVGIPPQDAQFIETRQFGVVEIARIFNVPPHKLRDLTRATFSNIEHQEIDFVTSTMLPWLIRWEQEIWIKLLSPAEQNTGHHAKHVVAGLLRGDQAARAAYFATARQWGWMSANDIRELDEENPIPGGDIYLSPANMLPADQIGKEPAPEPAPPATGPVPGSTDDDPDDDDRATTTETETQTVTLTAIQPVLADALGRMLRREAKHVRTTVKYPTKFAEAIRLFYSEHEKQVRAAVGPACDTIALATGMSTEGAVQLAKNMALRHVRQSVGTLDPVTLVNSADELGTALEPYLIAWETLRADGQATIELERITNAIAATKTE